MRPFAVLRRRAGPRRRLRARSSCAARGPGRRVSTERIPPRLAPTFGRQRCQLASSAIAATTTSGASICGVWPTPGSISILASGRRLGELRGARRDAEPVGLAPDHGHRDLDPVGVEGLVELRAQALRVLDPLADHRAVDVVAGEAVDDRLVDPGGVGEGEGPVEAAGDRAHDRRRHRRRHADDPRDRREPVEGEERAAPSGSRRGRSGPLPASGRSESSASRSATQPPSELPATTTSPPEASAASSTAAAAKSTSWSRTEPASSGGAEPNPGRS